MTQNIHFDTILNNIPSINMGARSANAPLTQSYDKGPDVPLIEATIGDFFDAIVSKYPEREALVVCHQNIRWTYQQLQQQVNQLASSMIGWGLRLVTVSVSGRTTMLNGYSCNWQLPRLVLF